MRVAPFFRNNYALVVNNITVDNFGPAVLQDVQRVGQPRATGPKKKRRVLQLFVPHLASGCTTGAFRPLTPNHTELGVRCSGFFGPLWT